MTTPTTSAEAKPPPSGFRRLRRWLLIFVVLPYIVLLVLLAVMQRLLLFPATQVESLPAASVAGYPPDLMRDVEITTGDDVTIRGWLFLSSPLDEERPPHNRWLVILFHGNAGHRGGRVPIAREFARRDCDVLLIDYRGYGDSEGSPSRDGLVQDAIATWKYATNELQRPPDRIVLFGESLGGAVAVELAQHCCREGSPPAGLLLSATFANLPETAARLYPAFPVRWLVRDRFSPRDLIPSVTCPIVQVHGRLDELVVLDDAEELFAAAPAASSSGIAKRFVLLEDADHNGVPPNTLGDELGELLDAMESTSQ